MSGPEENYDPTTGLLSAAGMDQALDAELSRASRHEIPLSLIYLELSPPEGAELERVDRHLLSRVAETLLGSARAEDRIARIGELRFAVLATEGDDGETLARRLGERVLGRLRGTTGEGMTIAVAAVDCQFDEMTRRQLIAHVERELAAAIEGDGAISTSPGRAAGRSEVA